MKMYIEYDETKKMAIAAYPSDWDMVNTPRDYNRIVSDDLWIDLTRSKTCHQEISFGTDGNPYLRELPRTDAQREKERGGEYDYAMNIRDKYSGLLVLGRITKEEYDSKEALILTYREAVRATQGAPGYPDIVEYPPRPDIS